LFHAMSKVISKKPVAASYAIRQSMSMFAMLWHHGRIHRQNPATQGVVRNPGRHPKSGGISIQAWHIKAGGPKKAGRPAG